MIKELLITLQNIFWEFQEVKTHNKTFNLDWCIISANFQRIDKSKLECFVLVMH